MQKLKLAAGLAAVALMVPAGAVAKPAPDQDDKRAAIAQCKSERGNIKATREAWKTKYKSMSRCVRQNAAEEAAEEQAAARNASKECKAEAADPDFAATHDGKTFAEYYGSKPNGQGKNAHGKCVSGKAKAKKAELDATDEQEAKEFRNAAKQCADERKADADAFKETYGTNANKSNAFGKCVSRKTRES